MRHIHQYKRINIARKPNKQYYVYACQKPGCSHYKISELLEGKEAECPRCDKPFTLDKEALKLVVPHCKDCTIIKEENLEPAHQM